MIIRKALMEDLNLVTEQTLLLYNDHTFDDLLIENERLLKNEKQIVFLAFESNKCIGFTHCSLRYDYVEGTKGGNVGYLEGIYVDPDFRNRGIASALLKECEKWSLSKGCHEIASDCELDNLISYNFHINVGFAEANRIICFTKKINSDKHGK